MTIKNANKILVIDDDTTILDFLMDLLKDEVSVSYASEGANVIELTRLHKPDLILLDVMMPGIDGFEICKLLKANPDTQHIPVVFLTAKSDGEDIATGLELGAIDYITKPFDPEIIVTKIRNILIQITASRAASDLQEQESNAQNVASDRRAEGENRPDRIPKPAFDETIERRAEGANRPDRILKAPPEAVIERRAEGASRADRFDKPAQKSEGQGISPTKVLIICLLAAILGGGGYAWYDNELDIRAGESDSMTDTTPATPAPSNELSKDAVNSIVIGEPDDQTNTTPSEPSTITCDKLPKVAWWGNASHDSIANYVNNKANGDWGAYIVKWERQLEKLSSIYAKGGTVIAPKLGTRLTGPVLGEYITQVEARLEVTRCLAKAHGAQ